MRQKFIDIPSVNMCLSYHSWEHQVQIFGLIRNDIKSMWLVGEEEGEVHIGFIVSFTQSTPQYFKRYKQYCITNIQADLLLTFLFTVDAFQLKMIEVKSQMLTDASVLSFFSLPWAPKVL